MLEQNPEQMQSNAVDSGLASLTLVLNLLEQPVKAQVLRQYIGQAERFSVADIVRGAQACEAEAEYLQTSQERLNKFKPPFIVQLQNGEFAVVTGLHEREVLLRKVSGEGEEVLQWDDFVTQWSGDLIYIRAARSKSKRGGIDFGRYGLNWFIPQLLRYRSAFANVLMASLLIQVFALITPLFTMIVIDKVLSTSGYTTLDVLALGLLAVALFDFIIGGLRSHLLGDLSNRVDAELVARLFRHLLRLPMSYFNRQRTGDTVNRLRELEAIRNFFTGPSLMAVIDLPFTFVFVLVMLWFSPVLTALVLGAIVILLLIYILVGGLLRQRIRAKQCSHADNQSFLIESIGSIELFKSLAVENHMQRQWEEHTLANSRVSRQMEQLNHGLTQSAGLVNKLLVAAALWIGAKAVLSGDMTAGQLIGFNMMISRVMAPALRIAQLFQHFQQTHVSLQRIQELLSVPPEYANSNPVKRLPAVQGDIRFENVSFAYHPEQPFILEDIHFHVQAGEVMGIVGISGAGKSTLMRLLQRLYVPQKGRILIDGVNIASADPDWLRRQIATVTQDNILLNRSIRDNIALAVPGMSIERIEAAARLAGADAFIRALPEAYNTIVGERGATLSMGQRQRIALARALAVNPRLLILDEATSSLDYEAEREIQQNMQAIVKGRTVFIIAHRLSTLSLVDRIIVLEHGRIAESGALKQLLHSNGRFHRLYHKQLDLLRRQQAVTA